MKRETFIRSPHYRGVLPIRNISRLAKFTRWLQKRIARAGTVLCTTLTMFLPFAQAQVIPNKAVWYQPFRQSFWAELADTTNGGREALINSMLQDFRFIKDNLHANAIEIVLWDEDSHVGQFGGGLSWDPRNRPTAQRAVGQEIILNIANYIGLKVIFVVNFSYYHWLVDDTYGSNPPPPNLPGAYDFIHSLIDPAVYYGALCTTPYLYNVGLMDSCIGGYFNDSRIAGWIFNGEWCVEDFNCDDGTGYVPTIATQNRNFINKYWGFFYQLVHWNGSTSSFAGIFTAVSPDDPGSVDQKGRIDAFKAMFGGRTGNPMPDQIGFQWYGRGTYPLGGTRIAADLTRIFGYMRDDPPFPVAANQILLSEGGSDQSESIAKGQFFASAINTAATIDGPNSPVATFGVWDADDYGNGPGDCGSAVSTTIQFRIVVAAFSASPPCVQYPPSAVGWHYYNGGPYTSPASYLTILSDYKSNFGMLTFQYAMPESGFAVNSGFMNH